MRRKRAVPNAIAVLVSLVVIFPVYWMFATALKQPGRILSATPEFIPWPLSLDNFRTALTHGPFLHYVRNSLLVSVSTVLIALVVALGASIALARFRFLGRRAFLVGLVLVQMVPGSAMVIPLYLMLRSVGAIDFVPGLIITYMTFVLPFTIWTLRGFVAGIPLELEEAAMVDGCGRFGAFWHIQLPLLAPGIVATSIFAFISAWDDYLFAYVFLKSQNNYTLPVWLVSFQTSDGIDNGATIAASAVFSLPVLIVFLLIQRRLVGGMTAGAVKG